LEMLQNSTHRIGLRINPLIDAGSPSDLTVSDNRSKFGVPMSLKKEIIDAYHQFDNLQGIHIHIGSQIGNYKAWVQAILAVYQLAEEINQKRSDQIQFIDIGGGLPADYTHEDAEGMKEIAEELNTTIPELFDKYIVYSEFGRFVHANAGWAVSKIEDVLPYTNPKTAVVHLGADMFLRDVYSDNKIHHSLDLLDDEEDDAKEEFQIAGPLCFGGDFINRKVLLSKEVSSGKRLIINDIGANTFSLWSMHCSRSFPKVIMHDGDGSVDVIKNRVDAQKMITFWQ